MEFDADSIRKDWQEYAALNAAYAEDSLDARASSDLELLRKLDDEEALRDPKVKRRLRQIQVVMRSKTKQLLESPDWEEKGAATGAEFQSAPRTFLKTVQEALSHPTERMAYKEEDDEQRGLQSLSIDPRRITNTLLTNLGLTNFIPPKGAKKEEQLASYADAIPSIREMLAHLEPITVPGEEQDKEHLKYFRLMRIAQGPTRGSLLGTQINEGNKILFRTDVYGEERRLLHIETGYEEEVKKLMWIDFTLRDIHKKLGRWSDVNNSEELEVMKQGLMECVDSLEFARDPSKVELKRKIEQCLTFRDWPGRPNPGATQAAMTKAFKYLGNRVKRIERIRPHLSKDKTRICQLVEGQKEIMDSFLDEIETLHPRFRILKESPLQEQDRTKIIRNLRSRQETFAALKFEPFLTFAQKLITQIDVTICALTENRDEDAAKEFIKIYLIAKVIRAHNGLQEVYTKISTNPEQIDPELLLEEIKEVNEKFSQREVAPQVKIEEVRDEYDEVYHLFNSLKMRLKELLHPEECEQKSEETDVIKEEETYKRTTLDSIIEGIKSKLPRLGKFVERIKGMLPSFLKPKKEQEPEPVSAPIQHQKQEKPRYTKAQKLEKFERMKSRIKNFNFNEVIQGL